jgi:hypothetical protein
VPLDVPDQGDGAEDGMDRDGDRLHARPGDSFPANKTLPVPSRLSIIYGLYFLELL